MNTLKWARKLRLGSDPSVECHQQDLQIAPGMAQPSCQKEDFGISRPKSLPTATVSCRPSLSHHIWSQIGHSCNSTETQTLKWIVLVVRALHSAHACGTGHLTVMVTLSLTHRKGERELDRALLWVLGANFSLSLPVLVTVPWQHYLDLLLEVNADEIPPDNESC